MYLSAPGDPDALTYAATLTPDFGSSAGLFGTSTWAEVSLKLSADPK